MPFVPPRPKGLDIKLTVWPTLNLCPCTKYSIMSNGFACHVGGTKQLQLSASWKILYHEIAGWGDFNGFYFVVKWCSPSWRRIVPATGRITLRENQDLPHNAGRAIDGRKGPASGRCRAARNTNSRAIP
jgi:hypothetical protein